MFFYTLLFLVPGLFALTHPKQRWSLNLSIFLWLILTFIIGLRHEVGGDWFRYMEYVDRVIGSELSSISLIRDPAYTILTWLSANMGLSVYGVNLICAAIFSFGLILFCRVQPRPWLALTISIPLMVIIIAMGYTRQAAAIGFLMPAYLSIGKNKFWSSLGWIILATSFQQTSIIASIFLMTINRKGSKANKFMLILLTAISSFILYKVFLEARLGIFIVLSNNIV